MSKFKVGDWVYGSDWCYGQITLINGNYCHVEFNTDGGGGCFIFPIKELTHAEPPKVYSSDPDTNQSLHYIMEEFKRLIKHARLLGFDIRLSPESNDNLGLYYHEILKYAGERHLWVEFEYEPICNAFKLRLSGRAFKGQRFGCGVTVPVDHLEYALSEPKDLANHILYGIDHSLHKNGFYPPKPLHVTEPIALFIELSEDPRQLRLVPGSLWSEQ